MDELGAQFVKELEQEFAECFGTPEWRLPPNFDALVVLSEGPDTQYPPEDERREKTCDLTSRTRYACRLFFERQKGRPPLLVLDGYEAQLEQMQKIIRTLGVPLHCVYMLNCGQPGVANTKSQMEALRACPLASTLRQIVIVTSTYHVPRAARTAAAQLPSNLGWAVIGVPGDAALYDPASKAKGEIDRIVKYSSSGDIVARLPHKLWRNFA